MSCIVDSNIKLGISTFTIVILLISGSLISIGVINKLTLDILFNVIPETYNYIQCIQFLTIILGVSLAFAALIGLTILSFQNYIALIVVIAICQFSLGIFAFIQPKDQDNFSKVINTSVDTIFNKTKNGNLINLLQTDLKCCGTYGPDFWNQTLNKPFPKTCCTDKICSNVFHTGCQNSVFTFFVDNCRNTGITLLFFSIIEVTGVVVCCFINFKKKTKKKHFVIWKKRNGPHTYHYVEMKVLK